MVARLRSWALAVWHFVSNAPLTYAWLVVLVITTIIQNNLTGSQLHFVLLHRSTNIAELGRDPLEVLFSSLLWIDGRNLEPYLLLFTLFLAPAEHWLGHLRWLTVGLTAHIGATYLSEGLLYLAIQHRDASERMVHARDIGVSYFLVGVMAVLTYHIAKPWRWGYLRGAAGHLWFSADRDGQSRAGLHRGRSLRVHPDWSAVLSDGPGTRRSAVESGQNQKSAAQARHPRTAGLRCATTTLSTPSARLRRPCWPACPTVR